MKEKKARWIDKIKTHMGEVLEIKKSPLSLAFGFALGTVIAVLPTFGLGVFIGLALLLVFKRISKVAMLAAFVIWNPLILLLVNSLNYYIGTQILAGRSVGGGSIEVYNALVIYSQRILVGSLVTTVIIGTISFILVYYSATIYYNKQEVLRKITEEVNVHFSPIDEE